MHLIKNGNKYYTVKNNNSNYGIYGNYYTIINGRLLWANPDIYLQSSGEQYIDTGYYLQSNNLKVKTKFTFDFSTYSSEKDILGSLGSNRFSIGTLSRKVFAYSRTGNTTNSLTSNTFNGIQTLDSEIIYDYDNSTKEIKIDGNTISGTNTIPIASTSNLLLLGPNLDRLFIGNIYYCKIYDNNSLVRHFVPVPKGLLIGNFVVPSNGMFDIVNQQFYENQGTGEFEIGGIPEDYIIDGGKLIWCNDNIYLQSTGTQYIETNHFANSGTLVEGSFQFTDTTVQQRVFGADSSYNTILYSLSVYINGSSKWAFSSNDGIGAWINTGISKNTNKHKYQVGYPNGGYLYIDGTKSPIVKGTQNNTANQSLVVFADKKETGNISNFAKIKEWYFIIYQDSIIKQYLVPVPKEMLIGDKIAPSNCMFDLVTQTFFENQGTGTFIYGKDN